jgi:hypothetical protein
VVDVVQLLEQAPAPVRAFAYRVASGRGLLGRLADRARFRFDDADIPLPPPVSSQSTRVVIGPVNSAGQGYRWARAIERRSPEVHAVSVLATGGNAFLPVVDLVVPVGVAQRSSVWHERFGAFLQQQTHVIWESGLPLLGRRFDSVTEEMRWVAARGARPGLLFHGSDIRPPAAHAARSIWSPYRERTGPIHALEQTTRHNAELAARADAPLFVSTPDLLEWVPGSSWVPVVVDPAAWRGRASALTSQGPPVVVHAPTQRWIKGTDLIEPLLHRLTAEGVIVYRPLAGVPHSAMPDFYGAADIVLDQFRLGSYGVAACEALAAGRLVIGHVDDATRSWVRATTGLGLPIHEATVDSLESELRRAAADQRAFGDFATTGPAFVDAVHDGRRSAAALAPYLGVSA